MKNFHHSLIAALATAALAFSAPASVAATPDSKDMRIVEKMAVGQTRELSAEGWKSMAVTPLEDLFKSHIAATELDGMIEQSGTSSKTKSRNNGRMLARSNATSRYTAAWVSKLKGELSRSLGTQAMESNDLDQFFGAFERHLEGEIRGAMTESVAMVREHADGACEVSILYLIAPQKESEALASATRNAIAETGLPQEYATPIAEALNTNRR